MRICLDYRPALRDGTGVGTYVRNLLNALVRRYPEHSFTAFSSSWTDRLGAPVEAANLTVRDRRIPVRILDRMWHRWGWPPLERLAGPQDIAHSPSPMPIPTRHARRLVTVHDCYFLRAPEDVFGPVRRDYVPLARNAARRADAIVVPSRSTAAEVEELLGIEPDRIHVTPLAVAPEFVGVEPLDQEARQALRSRHRLGPPYLLFVGRREARKNLGALLAALVEIADAVDDIGLVIAGPSAPGWEEVWRQAPEAARQRTRLLPHLSQRELAELYAAAELLVLPSRWEGFGLPALEAMAVGAPVVATRVGALPEVLGDAALWAESTSPEALARACLRILVDGGLAAEHRQRGYERAARYSWTTTAELTYRAYERASS